jgi:radical SAM superfamily enzyme YgiQ (UPF0313 family)
MKLTLIKPNIGRLEHSLYVDEGRMEPLTLGVLGALTPPDVEVALYDDRIEPVPYDEPTDLVAITVETFTARRACEIAAEYRRRGVPVVLGGMHVSLLPEETGRHADSIFIGDAEAGWARAMADAQAGRLQPRYVAPPGIAQQTRILTNLKDDESRFVQKSVGNNLNDPYKEYPHKAQQIVDAWMADNPSEAAL